MRKQLKTAIEDDLESKHFRMADEETFQLQVDKTIQMYETLLTRHTCMIVGPTGGGKSVVLGSLQRSMLSGFDNVVKMFVLNPKA